MAIMPVTVGALRKLRADKRKAAVNVRVRAALREAVSDMRRKPTEKKVSELFSKLDRAVKGRVIHKNKAARLKSRLVALVKKK
jgi:small subunit ribosomal protein S20